MCVICVLSILDGYLDILYQSILFEIWVQMRTMATQLSCLFTAIVLILFLLFTIFVLVICTAYVQ
jgi:ABC-type transport system involved in Fe-S cluster assembly fused permease/ATPase subunit